MEYTQVENKVVNSDGDIAVQHRTTNPTAVKVDGQYYFFTPQHNVSLSWIKPQHLDKVLGEMARICCGQQGKKFFLASLTNVNIWHTGNR